MMAVKTVVGMNQQVGGSNPFAGSIFLGKNPLTFINNYLKIRGLISTEGFPSGQRGQTVNLLAQPSEVRILPPPPVM